MPSFRRACLLSMFVIAATAAVDASADPIPAGAVGQNVEAVGYSNLADHPGFKMSILEANGRWYLYVGQLWDPGWQILDVTDPADPRIVKLIEGPDNTATDQMEIADGKMITNRQLRIT